MENAADVNPYILGLPDTLIPAAKRAQKRASALTDVTSTRNSAKLKPREAPKAQFSSANATFYAAGKTGQIYLLYIEKEGFWTLTPNLQQMHESLREYHHLVIRGEKKISRAFWQLAQETGRLVSALMWALQRCTSPCRSLNIHHFYSLCISSCYFLLLDAQFEVSLRIHHVLK